MSSMMPPQGGMPPQLAALLGGGGGDSGYGDQQEQQSPLDVLQECIQSLPGVIHALPDPKDTQEAVKALLILTGIQTRLMQQGNGSSGQGG